MRIPGTFIYQALKQGLRNPQVRPWVLMGTLAYLASPIDLIPAFFPGIGELDDLLVLSLLVRALISLWLEDPLAVLRQQVQASDPGPLKDRGPLREDRQDPQGEIIDIEATSVD